MLTFSLESYLEKQEDTAVVPANEQVFGCDMDLDHIAFESDVRTDADFELLSTEIDMHVANSSYEALSRLETSLNASLENGGLKTNFEVQSFHDLYNQATNCLGSQKLELPAMEAMLQDGAAEIETRVSLEKVKDTLKKVGAAIVAVFEKVVDFVMKIYEQYFSRAGKARSNLEAMAKLLPKVKGQPKEKELKVSNGNYLKSKGDIELVRYAEMIAKDKDIARVMKEMGVAIKNASADDAGKALADLKSVEFKLVEAVLSGFQIKKPVTGKDIIKKAGFKKADSYKSFMMGPVLAGGGMVVVGVPDADSMRPLMVGFVFNETGGDNTLPALKDTEMGAVIKDGLSALASHDAVIADMKGNIEEINAFKASLAKLAKDVNDNPAAKDLAVYLKDLPTRIKAAYELHRSISNQLAAYAAACGDYVKSSMKNLASEAPKADPAAAAE